jgi:mono/diheme cytochrome c family protein
MRAAPIRGAIVAVVGLLGICLPGATAAETANPAPSVERGAYLFAAAGCAGCHTDVKNDGPLLAGGRAIETPFGTFYGPNITPDPEYGIGGWSDADFIRALRHGVAPDGSHYYPAFPYTSFTGITDADLLDLKAYIFSLPPVAKPNKPHDLRFPFGWRFLLGFWKALNFTPGPFEPDPAQSAEWNRGAYLVQALTHCGECHTPRTAIGATDPSRSLAGTPDGPEGEPAPNITPHPETGIGSWSRTELVRLLKTGMLPNFDVVGSFMGEVVEQSTRRLSEDDLRAIAVYLESLPPIDNPEAKATQAGFDF